VKEQSVIPHKEDAAGQPTPKGFKEMSVMPPREVEKPPQEEPKKEVTPKKK